MHSENNLHNLLCNTFCDWPDLATTPLSLFFQRGHRLSSLSPQSSHCWVLGGVVWRGVWEPREVSAL